MTYKFHVAVNPYFRLQQTHFRLPVSQERAAQSSWTVPALCARYRWPTGLAGGGVIGVVELGGGWTVNDMIAYFGSGPEYPSITDVSVDGTRNTPGSDADYEVALDIQVAAAAYYAATGKPATVRVYWAQDIAPAVRAAAKDGCDVFSISWGADEAQWGAAAAQDLESAIAAATLGGMVVFAASGDNDSSDGGPTPANVDLPAGCPHTIGCGGTNLTQTSETVWNNNPGQASGEGTGGGYSTLFPAQAWQTGIPAAPQGLGRMVPDVASVADPNTGINIVVRGTNVVIGGTSAAAPLWAGLVAACGRKLGFITPQLYAAPAFAAFNDITLGDNGDYRAGVGPDPCTGMGSPDGMVIAMLLGSTVAPPTTTPAPPTTKPPGTTPAPTTTHPPQPTTTPAPGHHHHHPPHRHHGR